jgi:hypothetical protein
MTSITALELKLRTHTQVCTLESTTAVERFQSFVWYYVKHELAIGSNTPTGHLEYRDLGYFFYYVELNAQIAPRLRNLHRHQICIFPRVSDSEQLYNWRAVSQSVSQSVLASSPFWESCPDVYVLSDHYEFSRQAPSSLTRREDGSVCYQLSCLCHLAVSRW